MTPVLRPCSMPGCPELVSSGRCPAHAKPKQQAPRPAGYYRAYDRTWRQRSAAVLRDCPVCARCGAPSEVVDHILPIAAGGTHDWSNLQPLCRRCHASKTGRERRARQA